MENLKEQLLWKLEYYETVLRMSKERQIDTPNETLRVSKSHNRNQYYCYTGERLILTYETERNVLSTGKIKQMVERYLVQ